MTIETIQAGKATLTLAHGCRLTFVDADGIARVIDGEPGVIRLFRAMQLGSGRTEGRGTVKSEGRERPRNADGDPIYASYHS